MAVHSQYFRNDSCPFAGKAIHSERPSTRNSFVNVRVRFLGQASTRDRRLLGMGIGKIRARYLDKLSIRNGRPWHLLHLVSLFVLGLFKLMLYHRFSFFAYYILVCSHV